MGLGPGAFEVISTIRRRRGGVGDIQESGQVGRFHHGSYGGSRYKAAGIKAEWCVRWLVVRKKG